MGSEKDKKVQIHTQNTIGDLKELYVKGTDTQAENVRLFFGGRELKDENNVAQSNLINKVVIQASIRKLPSN